MNKEKVDTNSSSTPDLTDLTKTYLSKNSISLLSDRVEQQKIVEEIISILARQSAATQEPNTPEEAQKRGVEKPQPGVVRAYSSSVSEKKGLFSWVRRLFGS